MPLDIQKLIETQAQNNLSLHSQFVNPQFTKVLKTIGFDQSYTQGEGVYLYDNKKTRFLDFLSGFGVFALGRNHPEIKKTLIQALELNLSNLVQMDAPLFSGLLGEKMIKLVNQSQINKVFFCNSGTEANEAALKFAKAFTKRDRFLYLDHAFHGLTTGSLSVNGNDEFRDGFGQLLPGEKIPFNDLETLEKELKKKDVAGFFFEPIQGKGVFIPEDNFLPKAFELCKKYNTLFIADEIQTGLGRTGKWFGYEHWNLKPDIITVAKVLSGGFIPIGACLYGDNIYEKTFSRMDRCVVHSSTFGKNSLAMICALATLEILQRENFPEKVGALGKQFLTQLAPLKEKHDWIKDIRGKGLLIGIEFGKPQGLKKKIQWEMIHKVDKGLFGELIVMPLMAKHHILTQVSGHHQDIVRLIPPFIIEPQHIDQFVSALDEVLEECGKVTGPIWNMGKNLIKHSLENKYAGH